MALKICIALKGLGYFYCFSHILSCLLIKECMHKEKNHFLTIPFALTNMSDI